MVGPIPVPAPLRLHVPHTTAERSELLMTPNFDFRLNLHKSTCCVAISPIRTPFPYWGMEGIISAGERNQIVYKIKKFINSDEMPDTNFLDENIFGLKIGF